jgi:hypothetical protein
LIKKIFEIEVPDGEEDHLTEDYIAASLLVRSILIPGDIKVTEVFKELKHYHVWMEGYACTGQSSDAQYKGCVKATSFQDACDQLLKDDETYDSTRLTLWACKLYDNETDARKFFG